MRRVTASPHLGAQRGERRERRRRAVDLEPRLRRRTNGDRVRAAAWRMMARPRNDDE
jgi:hypothetical protein